VVGIHDGQPQRPVWVGVRDYLGRQLVNKKPTSPIIFLMVNDIPKPLELYSKALKTKSKSWLSLYIHSPHCCL
jgi:hypothetical protein